MLTAQELRQKMYDNLEDSAEFKDIKSEIEKAAATSNSSISINRLKRNSDANRL